MCGQEKCTPPLPRPEKSFANNKRFAMKVKEAGTMGLINTFWGSNPMEMSWFGIIAGAEYSWTSRNETIEEFNKRFLCYLLACEDMDNPILIDMSREMLLDNDGFRNESWVVSENTEQLLARMNSLENKLNSNRNIYIDILSWTQKANALMNDLKIIFNEIDRTLAGAGTDFPLTSGNGRIATFATALLYSLIPLKYCRERGEPSE